MSFLAFLGAVDAKPQEKTQKAGGIAKKERNPVTGDLRVFRTGAVYPSAALVKKHELEYTTKSAAQPGFGFDVVDGRFWSNLQSTNPALFISPVRRDLGKVDLFGLCSYETDGTPSSSVLDQGAVTYGKKLLSMIKEVYGAEIAEGQDYIDLVIVEDAELQAFLDKAFNRVFHFPKQISRGDNAGQLTYVKREHAKVFGLMPESMFRGQATGADIATGNNDELVASPEIVPEATATEIGA